MALDGRSEPDCANKYYEKRGEHLDGPWTVYTHVNKANGKTYVGVTSKQKPEHRWNSGRGYIDNPYFYSAIEKYGWDGFDHNIVANGLSKEVAFQMEIDLIRELRTQEHDYGYNLTSGGEGTPNYHPSEETRRKLSIARMRENLSEETLRRRSEGLRGRKFTYEHKKKIGDGNSKAVSMFSKDGVLIRSFRGARDAEVELGIHHSHISQCCHGQRKTAGGYIWQFAQ